MLGEGGHDGDLAADVFDVHSCPQLTLRDRLTCEEFLRFAIGAEVGDAEFSTAELVAEDVLVVDADAVAVAEGDDVFEDLDGGGGGVFGEGVGALAEVTATALGVGTEADEGVAHC